MLNSIRRLLNKPDPEETRLELRRDRVLSERRRREIARRLAAVEVTMPVRREEEVK